MAFDIVREWDMAAADATCGDELGPFDKIGEAVTVGDAAV